MLFDLIQLLLAPEEYVCSRRDGELYIEPVEASVAALRNDIQAAEGAVERRAP
jgi:hypothetical protein